MFSIYYLQAGQNPIAWIWYMLLTVVVLLLIFWWVNRRNDVPLKEPSSTVLPAREPFAEDLQKIEGIGPKVSRVLNEAGITTFEALARANPADIQKRLNATGLQMMNREGWIELQKEIGRDWNAYRVAKGWKEKVGERKARCAFIGPDLS